MSTWRRKALELFPDLRKEINQRGVTIYSAFFELLHRCREAHQENNTKELEKIYDYAEWCFRQKDYHLSNAAAVAFYEHLVDFRETKSEMNRWVKPEIFEEIASLLEFRMDKEEFAHLGKLFIHNG